MADDKQWASKYLLDPLTAPEPSQETGPGSHFTSHKKTASSSSSSAYPTPPSSSSPSRTTFSPTNPYSPSHRQEAFGAYPNEGTNKRNSVDGFKGDNNNPTRLRRGSSLSERFPGDMSHRPLDQIKKDAKAANRSPHLRRNHIPGADLIDNLDKTVVGGAYHHGGPYDATLLARNINIKDSPVEAVRDSNTEALKATPREHIRDALDKHVPLQGTAIIPPGARDFAGRQMQYEEGADMMREPGMIGGEYRRWEGIQYHPDDLKGKGEPSYTIEKALKEGKGKSHRRVMSDGNEGYEMQSQFGAVNRQRSNSGSSAGLGVPASNSVGYAQFEGDMRRSHTTGRKVGETLKKRFGSLRRSKKTTGD